MNEVIEAIREALATDATTEARANGVAACRAVLTALEAAPGEAFTATPIPVASATPQVTNIVSMLRSVPPDQLLDLAIAKLRAALPAGADVAQVQPLKFQFIAKTHLDVLAREP
jgi:hypothetical protein